MTNQTPTFIEEKLEKVFDLKCVNGAMYFGVVEEPCSGRETGECCQNEQTWEEAEKELKDFLKQSLTEAIAQGRKETNDEIQKIIEKYRLNYGGHLGKIGNIIEDLTKLIK